MAEIEFITSHDSRSPISEAYRSIRTNLQFSSIDKELKLIVFTSARPNEGKSTTIANLAIVMGQDNKKTLLIDCDLRKPVVHQRFGLPNKGLTNCLVDKISLREVIQDSGFDNVDIVTAGPIPPNPAELLSSARMMELLDEVKADYDYIFLDMPPVLVVTDAAIMANKADGVVIVIASGEESPEEGKEVKSLLVKGRANIIGVILNKMPYQHRGNYYYYYYYYDEEHHKRRKKHHHEE